jgi:FkbM family methyltransferase
MKYQTTIEFWRNFIVLKLVNDHIEFNVDDGMINFINKTDLSGKNVIDGGSNIGLMSLLFSELLGDGKVYSFELQKVINQIGCDNMVLNGVKNVISHNAALSTYSGGEVGFSNIDYGAEQVSSTGIRVEPNGAMDMVKTIALDDMSIPNIGLIKLDLEGSEPEALNGMWKSIGKWRPNMIIELSDGYLGEKKVKQTIQQIESHGYYVTKASNHNYFCEPN